MNRLSLEQHRLYHPSPATGAEQVPEPADLVDDRGWVRALVLELARPADWTALSRVWQGVQTDLELPAPAIAVNGRDGFQLWFSLAEPVPAAQAHHFLDAVRHRWLGELSAQRLRLLPDAAPDTPGDRAAAVGAAGQLARGAARQIRHAALVPARLGGSELWSAFVSADLAPVLSEEPWLDLPPTPEAQASLLARLATTPAADFQRALGLLDARATALAGAHAATTAPRPDTAAGLADTAPDGASSAASGTNPTGALYRWLRPAAAAADARRFLHDVMTDDGVALVLRIDAAKALLADDLARGGATQRT
ncbi:MAG: hypothetical protein RIQ60_2034 [Pseudomonadota bacterium]|jgi:hypothetical protein